MISADRDRLLQVVGNLLDNAFKYTLGGGRVSLRACEHQGYADIIVQDPGPGIAPEDRLISSTFLAGRPCVTGKRGIGRGSSWAYLDRKHRRYRHHIPCQHPPRGHVIGEGAAPPRANVASCIPWAAWTDVAYAGDAYGT